MRVTVCVLLSLSLALFSLLMRSPRFAICFNETNKSKPPPPTPLTRYL